MTYQIRNPELVALLRADFYSRKETDQKLAGLAGDMAKAVYDTDNDGKVEAADYADNAGAVDGVDSSQIVYGENANKSTNVNGGTVNSGMPSGFSDGSGVTGAPDTGYWNFLNLRHRNTGNNYGNQLAFPFAALRLGPYWRNIDNGAYSAWMKIWTEYNDGSGSGLDADLLDGQEPSALSVNSAANAGNADTVDGYHASNIGDAHVHTGTFGKSGSGLTIAAGGAALYPDVQGQGGGAAGISFHRPNAYAVNFGLDTDNVLKIGGWSMGNASYKIWHDANRPESAVDHYFEVYRNTSLTIGSGSWVSIGWNTINQSVGGNWNWTAGDAYTVPTAGMYMLTFSFSLTGYTGEINVAVQLQRNNSDVLSQTIVRFDSTKNWGTIACLGYASSSSVYFRPLLFQNTGGNLTLAYLGNNSPYFRMARVGS